MALKYKQTFTVRGGFQFPVDMLRYDQCFPASELESAKIAQALHPAPEPWKVQLTRYTETRDDRPTVDRWRSFCAAVVETSITTERLP